MQINENYRYKTSPKANEKALVIGENYRFTILTSRLFRVEYSEGGKFEDSATQTVINRDFDVPNFTVTEKDGILKITTDSIQITYTKQPLSANSLSVCYTGKEAGVRAGRQSSEWHFAEENRFNLKSTARTLDAVDGECELELGIMSRGEITYIDDSKSLLISDDGLIEARESHCTDIYVFCYGRAGKKSFDNLQCLKDYYKLTGNTPLIPRYALGNWWSRYYAYTQDEYTELMKKFKKEDIPFSVAVLDMDWHYVDIDPQYGTGWTGYTWNKELFPNHREFLDFLKKEGLRCSLNLHPQEGVAAHEAAYAAMAEAMEHDISKGEAIEFDITNPKFIENYFSVLHHPLEEEGVDFWWIDWQQGNTTRVEGLDPLWMLNHYHYIDLKRQNRRPLIFSRYAGPGSHRYPIGFSGDSVISWDSLNFQPYFTATASNIGYTWWSHDIGGHMEGIRDEELITRWVQLGVFSPINRLHSSQNPFLGKEPWKYNKISELSMKRFLKLRHELIPYLYTMNYRTYAYSEPLVQPLYYNWAGLDEKGADIYKYKNEYTFGTEMLVSPITTPCNFETKLGCAQTFLPEGMWYDFFNNTRYTGGRTLCIHRDLGEMPVFVKAGGIIPMANLENTNDIDNPRSMKVKIYAGKSNSFELYEDDGESMDFESGKYATTKLSFIWSEKPVFTVEKPCGDISLLPVKRSYELEFIGLENCDDFVVTVDGIEHKFEKQYENNAIIMKVNDVSGELVVEFKENARLKENNIKAMLAHFLERAEISNIDKAEFYAKAASKDDTGAIISDISGYNFSKEVMLALIEIITSDTI